MTNSAVLLVPKGDGVRETMLCDSLSDLTHITSVTAYATMVSNKIPETYLDSSVVSQFYSENYARIILSADCAYEGDKAFSRVEAVQQTAEEYYPGSWYLCGQSANMYDIKSCVQQDNTTVTLITILSIYLILLLTTGNWFMPLLYFTGEPLLRTAFRRQTIPTGGRFSRVAVSNRSDIKAVRVVKHCVWDAIPLAAEFSPAGIVERLEGMMHILRWGLLF